MQDILGEKPGAGFMITAKNNMIEVKKEDGIAVLTINNPPMNVLNTNILLEMGKIFDEVKKGDVDVIIITGAGKAFVAGADIKEMKSKNPTQASEFSKLGQSVLSRIENFPKPVIGAANGFALGGGTELAMCCDIVVASENAKFGQPEVSLGVIPGFGGTQRLPRFVGKNKAKELIFTGSVIDANEALRIGLVNIVVKHEELMDAAKKLAEKIKSNAPIAVKLSKELINRDVDLNHALSLEADAFTLCFSTEDMKEGMNAFVEKRKPRFKGK
jgi:enoyl-CoA hydratase